MRVESVDFPSDPNCELPRNMREVLVTGLHRASESRDALVAFKAALGYAAKRLKDAEKELVEREAKIKAKIKADLEAEEAAKTAQIELDAKNAEEALAKAQANVERTKALLPKTDEDED